MPELGGGKESGRPVVSPGLVHVNLPESQEGPHHEGVAIAGRQVEGSPALAVAVVDVPSRTLQEQVHPSKVALLRGLQQFLVAENGRVIRFDDSSCVDA